MIGFTRPWQFLGGVALVLATTACPGDDGSGDGAGSDGTTGTTSGADTSANPTATDPDDGSGTGEGGSSSGGADGSTTDPGDSSSTGGDGSSGEDSGSSTGEAIQIPDPGGLMDQWQSNGDISTPMVAWPVGTATQMFPYIEGTAGDDGGAFFVFTAGPGYTMIDVLVFGGQDPTFIHLHDGTGLIFGDEIAADSSSAANQATFTVVPGNIYVLEVIFPGAGFF